MQTIARKVVHGVHILHYPGGPYIEVAERLRLLYTLGSDFRLQQAETMRVRNRWIYRAVISVDDRTFIGDAEIHFGAPKETPDGTNPVACAQTSAIGNALTFAGYGDLRLLLQKQHMSEEQAQVLYPNEPPYGDVEGIRVVWFDEIPYVPVEERIYHLYTSGHTLSMDHCEVICVHGVWVYRVWLRVDDRPLIGDAEVQFAAPVSAPQQRFPVSSAQTAAIGSALAFAGYGDLRTLLQRLGKSVEQVLWVPVLASADAIDQAQRVRQASAQPAITAEQQETIRGLSLTLAESLPALDGWTFEEAEMYIEALRAQVEELLSAADDATDDVEKAGSEEDTLASYSDIGELKRAWMQAAGIVAGAAGIKKRWETFKQRSYGASVNDDAMSRTQYLVLKSAIEQRQAKQQREH